MSEQGHDDPVVLARQAFIFKMVVRSWKWIVYVLAVSDIGSGLAIILGPPSNRNSVAFRLMSSIQLPNFSVAAILILGGFLLLFFRTATWGHLISAIANGWWSLLIFYIAIFLSQPTSLIAAAWAGPLALIHLIAGSGRIAIGRYDRVLTRNTRRARSDNG
jgi:hypothetical protein